MPYTPDRTPLGHDATPDWTTFASSDSIGTLLAAIPHKADDGPGRWTIIGWHYIGSNGWVDVDAAGVCYATGRVHLPPT